MLPPDNQNVVNRLNLYLQEKKINIFEFETTNSFSNGAFRKAIKNNGAIGSDKIEKILSNYPDLNPIWLMTGYGNMIISNDDNSYFAAAEPLINYKINLPANKLYQVPVFGVAEAGYIVGYSDDWSVYVESCTLPTHSEQLTRGFTVHGSSMEYLLSDGDVILCRRVLDVKEFSFHLEEIYVLVTIDGMVVKHVSKRENGFFVRSENPGYAPFFIPYEDVIEVWRAEMKLSYMVKQK